MAGSQIQRLGDVEEDAAAARFIGAKVARLRSAAKALGVGVRMTGKGGRTATYLGDHPGGYHGMFWWRIAEPATEEVG